LNILKEKQIEKSDISKKNSNQTCFALKETVRFEQLLKKFIDKSENKNRKMMNHDINILYLWTYFFRTSLFVLFFVLIAHVIL
jgi:hypothetical protein